MQYVLETKSPPKKSVFNLIFRRFAMTKLSGDKKQEVNNNTDSRTIMFNEVKEASR